jgi:nucleoside 2-deoxyribosyltransferase
MIRFLPIFLAAALFAADAPKLSTEQKLAWKDAVLKAVSAENATHRLKEQADREIARLQAEQQKAAQDAQAIAAKLLKEIKACDGAELTIEGDVKCPEPKK